MKNFLLSILILFAVVFSLPAAAQTVVQLVGTGQTGYNGSGLPALSTELSNPAAIALDKNGVIYFADDGNNLIRKIDASGNVITVAGNYPNYGYNGDGIAATSAYLDLPTAIAFDTAGNLYIADFGNNRIRKVDASGIITTVAGTGGGGYNGDGILAITAEINVPSGITFDASDNMYITEQNGYRVREVNTNGYISTVAGNGTPGYSGDNGPATDANLDGPYGIGFDQTGNLYIADVRDGTVRKIDVTGVITTVAGTGTPGYNGDGIPATTAQLSYPEGVVVDNTGTIYIADGANDRIRTINSTGIISTLVSDTGQIIVNNLEWESAVYKDNCGDLFFVDADNANIWKVGIPIDTGESIMPQSPLVCSGQSVSLIATSTGTNYTWSPATGLNTTTGDSVVATPTATTTYLVTSSSGGCIIANRDVITVIATPPFTIQPPSPILCAGLNIMLTAPPSGSGYSWSPSLSLSPSTGDSVIATPLVTTTYTITGTDSLGCTASGFDVVTVILSPNKPTFYQHGDTLISSSKNDNQWYYNDTLLINDTSRYLIITSLGQYWVVVNNEANGCSTSSDTVKIDSVTGINQLTMESGQLTVYPNPTSGQFTIKLNGNQNGYTVEVYNVMGEIVYQSPDKFPSGNLGVINLSSQPPGMYFVYLKSDEGVEVGKVLVTK